MQISIKFFFSLKADLMSYKLSKKQFCYFKNNSRKNHLKKSAIFFLPWLSQLSEICWSILSQLVRPFVKRSVHLLPLATLEVSFNSVAQSGSGIRRMQNTRCSQRQYDLGLFTWREEEGEDEEEEKESGGRKMKSRRAGGGRWEGGGELKN